MSEKETAERRASDNLCKDLAERYPQQFVEWLFSVRVEGLRILKTELHREPIRADAAMLLESAAEVFHIEFQTSKQSNIPLPLRMLDYYVGFKRRYLDKRIRQVLVLLTDKGQDIPNHYQDECAFFRYNVVRLWEVDPREILDHEELLPLAVLCRVEGSPEQLLQTVAQQIERISTLAQRRDTMLKAQLLAGLRFAESLVTKTLGELDMIEESVIYQSILRRGEQRGRQQGFDQGEKNIVLRQLNKRFGGLHWRTARQITSLSTTRLEELSETLFELQDLKELRTWLKRHKEVN